MAIRLPIISSFDPKGINKAKGAFGKFGGAVAGIAASAVTAVAGIGTAATKMASELETSFAKIQGLVGVSTAEVAKLEEAAIRLGPAYGKSAQEAADALFFITSAGLRGADATDVLEASLKASAAGLGDVNSIANAATAAMNTYGTEVLSGTDAVDALTEAVRLGQLAPEELSSALGKVIPIANELGVSFEETTGLVAGLTRGGLSASEAVTGVRGAMQAVLKPTGEAADMLQQYGTSTDEVRAMIEEDGLLATFGSLREAFAGNEEDFTRLIGSQEGLNAVLAMTGEASEEYTSIVEQMTDEVGALDEAFGAVEETAGFKFQRAMETARAALLPVGETLLEIGASLLDALMPVIDQLAPVLEEMFLHLKEPLIALVGLLPGLMEAFMPLLPIIGEIAGIFVDLVVALLPPFVALLEALIPVIGFVVEAINAFIVPLVEMLAPILTQIIELFTPIIEAILPILFILLETLLEPLMRFIEALIPFYEVVLPLLATVIETIVVPALELFADWLEVWLPAALDFLENSGLFPFLTAFEIFGASLKNGVNGLEVTIALALNAIIKGFEDAVRGAVRAAKRIASVLALLPGPQMLAARAIMSIPDIEEGAFGRVDVPERIYEFPEIDVQGISDSAMRVAERMDLVGRGPTLPGPRDLQQEARDLFGRRLGLTPLSEMSVRERAGLLPFGTPLLPGPQFRQDYVPAMAEGGIVNGPTLALIGEAGPEAVVPLKNRNMGTTININIQTGVGDPVRIGEEVVTAIKRYERVSGPVFASA